MVVTENGVISLEKSYRARKEIRDERRELAQIIGRLETFAAILNGYTAA